MLLKQGFTNPNSQDEVFIKNKKTNGAQGRTRTDTRLPLPDFESGASTSFTTWAFKKMYYNIYFLK